MASFNKPYLQQTIRLRTFLLKFLYVCIGVLCIIPVATLFIIVSAPQFLYRLLVTRVLAPCFRPKIGKAVTANAQFMATEFLKKSAIKASRYTMLVTLIQKGALTVTELRELLLARWIHAKNAQDGIPRYPELQQYIESWMGFMFWKQDANFDLDNHIVIHNLDKHAQQQEAENYLANLYDELFNEPFVRCRSPWEVHLIQNYKTSEVEDEELTAIIFRFHHVFGDGFAVAHMLIEVLFACKFENVQMPVPKRNKSSMNKWQKKQCSAEIIFNSLSFLFKFLHDFGSTINMICRKQHIWKRQRIMYGDIQTRSLRESWKKQCYLKSELISVEKLKAIKNRFKVTFSSVLLSSLSASLSKNFQENIPVIKKNNVRVSMMLPTGGHTKGLRHNEKYTIFSIDSRPQYDCVKRLLETEQRLNSTKRSYVPGVLYAFTRALSGSLAAPFASMVDSNQCMPVCTSNFRGPEKPFGLDRKRKIVLMDAMLGTYSDLMVIMYSYKGYMRIALTTTTDVLCRFQFEKVMADFCQEIENLYNVTMRDEIQ